MNPPYGWDLRPEKQNYEKWEAGSKEFLFPELGWLGPKATSRREFLLRFKMTDEAARIVRDGEIEWLLQRAKEPYPDFSLRDIENFHGTGFPISARIRGRVRYRDGSEKSASNNGVGFLEERGTLIPFRVECDVSYDWEIYHVATLEAERMAQVSIGTRVLNRKHLGREMAMERR